jgi:hypothetical protein
MRYGAPGFGDFRRMMVLVFAALLAAFVCGWLHKTAAAIGLLALAFVLAAALFLWEVYSPRYGFAMPWIQVERAAPLVATGEG